MSNVIDAVFKLTDNFSQPLSNCLDSLTDATKQGKKTRKSLEDISKGMTKAGTALTLGITTPLVAMGAAAYKNFSSFDMSLQLVKETMGETKWAAGDLEKAIDEAAANSILDVQDAVDASLNFARAGFDAAEASDMLQTSMDAAVGTSTDLSTVTAGLGDTLKIFKAESSEATNYMNAMVAGANAADTDLARVLDGVSEVGPLFQTVGYGIEDVVAAVDAFGDSGITASEGMNSMSTGLLRLATAKSTGYDAVDKAVESLFDEEGNLVSFTEVVGSLQKAFSGLSTEESLDAMNSLFGKNQSANWSALLNTDLSAIEGYYSEINDAVAGGSLVSDMAASQMNSEGAAMESLSSSIDVLSKNFGKLISGYINPFINKLIELTDYLNSLDDDTKDMIIKAAMVAAALGPVLTIVGKLVGFASSISGLIANIKLVGTISAGAAGAGGTAAGGGFLAGLGTIGSSIASILPPIAVAAGLIALIVSRWDDFKASCQEFASNNSGVFDQVGAAFQGLMTSLQPVVGFIQTVLLGAIQLLGNALVGLFDGFINGGGFSTFVQGLSDLVTGVITMLQGLIDFIVGVFTLNFETAWNGVVTFFDGIAQTLTGIGESIVGLFQSIGDGLAGIANGIGSTVGAWASSAVGAITGNASGDTSWRGGLTHVNEQGGELMSLPNGTTIVPHDLSKNRLFNTNSGSTVTITGNNFNVRSEADIDKITDQLVRKMYRAQANMGMA